MTDRCEPLPKDKHYRWHWLQHVDAAEPRPAEYQQSKWSHATWNMGVYFDSGTPQWMYARGWRYLGPCIPPDSLSRKPVLPLSPVLSGEAV